MPGSGEKTLTTISRLPNSVKWCVELLARRAGRSMEAAVAFLLAKGLPALWRGVDEIGRAREHVFAHGTTDDRAWFDACPPLDVASGGAAFRRYVIRIPDGLRRQAGALASQLGLPSGQIHVVGLMAGLLGAEVVPTEYRASMVETVRAYRQLVERRGVRARGMADATPVTDHTAVWTDIWTLDAICRHE